MTINKKGDPLWVPSFYKSSVSTFKNFKKFVAVRPFTADSSLLQPTGGVNTTPHTSYFTSNYMHMHGSSLGPHSFHHIHASCALCDRCVWLLSLRRLHFPLLPHRLLSYHPVLPSARGQIPCALPLRTLAPLPSTSLSLEDGVPGQSRTNWTISTFLELAKVELAKVEIDQSGSRPPSNAEKVRVCVKALPAEGRRSLHTNTAYGHLLGFSGPFSWTSPAGWRYSASGLRIRFLGEGFRAQGQGSGCSTFWRAPSFASTVSSW